MHVSLFLTEKPANESDPEERHKKRKRKRTNSGTS